MRSLQRYIDQSHLTRHVRRSIKQFKNATLVFFVINRQNQRKNRQPIVEEEAKNTRVVDSSCCRCRLVTRTKPYRSAGRAERVAMLCRHQIKRARTLPLAESGIFHQFPGFIRAPPATTLLPLRPANCSGRHTPLSMSNIGISRY